MGDKGSEFGSVDHCFPATLPVPRTLLSTPSPVSSDTLCPSCGSCLPPRAQLCVSPPNQPSSPTLPQAQATHPCERRRCGCSWHCRLWRGRGAQGP